MLECVAEDLFVEDAVALEVAGTSSLNVELPKRKRTRRKRNLGKEVLGTAVPKPGVGRSLSEGKTRKGKKKVRAPPKATKPAPAPKVAKEKRAKRGHGFGSLFAV